MSAEDRRRSACECHSHGSYRSYESDIRMQICADPPPTSLTRDAAAALASERAAEMIRRWRQGERPVAEEFLARHPQLWEHPEVAADLIYEELCLRQEFGPQA